MKRILTLCFVLVHAYGMSQIIQNINKTNGSVISNNIELVDSIVFLNGTQMKVLLHNAAPQQYMLETINHVDFTDGTVDSLGCGAAIQQGLLTAGIAASGAGFVMPYDGGNGGVYHAQSVPSAGINGLTATLSADTFALGSGYLTYTITGTPAAGGVVYFTVSIGGKTCVVSRHVFPSGNPAANATCGATNVHNPNLTYGSMTDQDGHVYKTTVINNKVWMAENLLVSHYANGDEIPTVEDSAQWANLNTGASCWYNNDSNTYACPFGRLYNWYAAIDLRNLCPSGWHVPSAAEWQSLGSFLGSLGGRKLKSTGYQYWDSLNNGGTNSHGFSALPGGLRGDVVGFRDMRKQAYYWSTKPNCLTSAAFFRTSYHSDFFTFQPEGSRNRRFGYSVRCIQDDSGTIQGMIDSLDCNAVFSTDTLVANAVSTGAGFTLSYTGGNGGVYPGQSFASTGVTGVTATLAAGNFSNGAGSVSFSLSGTPLAAGNVNFLINIRGKSCSVSIPVTPAVYSYPPGFVFCNNTATEVVELINPETGRIWMDRNLGAAQAAVSVNDAAAMGGLFQWGRTSDGHQCRNSPTTDVLSSIDQPANGNFITTTSAPIDWRIPQNDSLWQGVNGINNPCPNGFRVPTYAELYQEQMSWCEGYSNTYLKWTLGGFRSFVDGSIVNAGTWGFYWTSTVSGTDAKFIEINCFTGFFANRRGFGYSVRCIKN